MIKHLINNLKISNRLYFNIPVYNTQIFRLYSSFKNNSNNNNKNQYNNNISSSNNNNNNNNKNDDSDDIGNETIIDGLGKFSLFEGEIEKIDIPEKTMSITYKFARSSGPGGQNVNKVNTKCELRVNLEAAHWIPAWVKKNIKEKYERLVNKENELIIVSSKHRTQHHNRKDATDKLGHILDECSFKPKVRIPTEEPLYAIRERINNKKIRHDLKQQRKKKQIHEYFKDF